MKKQLYLYSFTDGGWNSEYAHSVEEAIYQAKTRWAESPKLEVDETTFRVSTNDEYYGLLCLAH